MHHFIAIGEFKLNLQSRNAWFGSYSAFFLSRVTLIFDGWPWKTIGLLFYANSSCVHHFVVIGALKLELQSGNAQFGSKWTIFVSRVTLKFDVWTWKTIGHLFKQHQALCIISSSCVNSSLTYSPETAKLGYDLCELDLWPMTFTFAWRSRLSLVITPENFMMIRWQEHSEKGVTDTQTDRQMDGQTDTKRCS